MHDVRTYIYIYIYKKHIYIYDEDFSQLYDKCGARAARQLLMINFIIIILLSLDYISFLIFLCFSISRNIHLLLYYNGYCIIIIIYILILLS